MKFLLLCRVYSPEVDQQTVKTTVLCSETQMNVVFVNFVRMLNHHCRRNPELHEELQIQAAVAAGDVYTVRRMLEQGYSPKIRDANGWTLLHFSAAKGKERCVRVFLEHGGQSFCPGFAEKQLHVAVITLPATRWRHCPEPASDGWRVNQNITGVHSCPFPFIAPLQRVMTQCIYSF